MKKEISFGKVDGYNSGKNNCEVVIALWVVSALTALPNSFPV